MRSIAKVAGVIAALALAAPVAALAQHQLDGADDAMSPQVARGQSAFVANCASCHGFHLSGGGAPALRGESFASRWLDTPEHLKALDGRLRTMPKGAPNSLPSKTYDDIKAYIVAANQGQRAGYAHAGPPTDLLKPPASVAAATTAAPTDAELLSPADGDWPMYNRTYAGDRFSPLTQIDAANAGALQPVCVVQMGEPSSFEASPVIYQGVGYVTTVYSTFAFDAATCQKKWTYTYSPTGPESALNNNRGVALYHGALYRGTSDSHLIAIDAATGKLLWDTHVADSSLGYDITAAPIVYHGLVIVGVAGSDFGVDGHIYGFDAKTGRVAWIFDTVPTGAEPGANSWQSGAATGGGATWSSFSADPKDDLVLAPIGNPAPDFLKTGRPGSNLYTDSVVALHATTGALAWYEQQRPADYHDWDTAAAPVLFEQDGRRFMAEASKDGYLYLYDRDRHALIAKTALTTISNTDAPLIFHQPVVVCPGAAGGVEWNGPAYSPLAKTLFVGAVDWCGHYVLGEPERPQTGDLFFAGTVSQPGERRGWIKALDASNGQESWSYHAPAPVVAGMTPTAGGVVMTGLANGAFLVFDAKDGRILYSFQTGAAISGGVSTYAVGGRQYVAVASGGGGGANFGPTGAPTVVVFALPAPGGANVH